MSSPTGFVKQIAAAKQPFDEYSDVSSASETRRNSPYSQGQYEREDIRLTGLEGVSSITGTENEQILILEGGPSTRSEDLEAERSSN